MSLEEEAVMLMSNRERAFPGRQHTTYKARVSQRVWGARTSGSYHISEFRAEQGQKPAGVRCWKP